MYEKLDVYDENRNKTGRIIERKEGEITSSNEYILAIQCWIISLFNYRFSKRLCLSVC